MSMRERITRLGKETALYGLSTIVGRMLNFLLVPLYANYLLPAENGIIATLYSYVAFAVVVYGLGMEQAFMRHWVDADEEGKGVVFRTALLGAAPGIVLTSLLLVFRSSVSEALGFWHEEDVLIGFAAAILALDTLAVVPYALLRMERRPLKFASFKVAGILATVALTVIFVVYGEYGGMGVFAANAIASAGVAVLLLFSVRRVLVRPQGSAWISMQGFRELLQFGVPLVPAGLAGIALQVIDRPIVRALTDDATVGLYQLNARLAIFMMLAVGMFDFAWRPFFLQHAKDEDAKDLFSTVFTYFSAFLLSIFLVVALFVDDLVRFPLGGKTFFPEFYWEGTSIIPVFLAANLLTGAYVVFLTGTYLSKRTGIVPVISGTAAAVTVGGNFLLVPAMGIMGAALAALAGHIVQSVWMYAVGQRQYPVRYAWRKLIPVAVWTAALYLGIAFLEPDPLTIPGTVMKLVAIGLFVWSLFLTRIITVRGLQELMTLRSRRKSP